MAHSRIWERENSHCYYENAQLHNMILAWEPDIFEEKIQDFDHVLGIYTQNYFKTSRFRFGCVNALGVQDRDCPYIF